MKRILVFFLSVLASFNCLQAQTNNLNQYYLKVYFNSGVGIVDNDGNSTGESRYHIRAKNYVSSDTPTHLLDTNVGADNIGDGATFYKYDHHPSNTQGHYGPNVRYPILPDGSSSNSTVQINTTGKFNLSVMSYAYDYEPENKYMSSTSGNMGYLDATFDFSSYIGNNIGPSQQVFSYRYIDNTADGYYDFGSYTGYGSDSYYNIEYCYRPKHGRRFSPLDFGTIEPGATAISQYNSTRSSPNSTYYNSTYFGYFNDWSGGAYQEGNDITYKFTLNEPQSVSINIARNPYENQIMPTIHLLNASEVSEISTEGNLEDYNLCAGTYYVVLDGVEPADFQISVSGINSSPPTVGTIARAPGGKTWLCPNEAIPTITESVSGTNPFGAPTYKWYKQLRVNGVGQGWVHYTAAGTGASAINLGTMENADGCWVARQGFTECGSLTLFSNQIFFSGYSVTLSAGAITGTTIPFPHEQSSSMGSLTNASSSPSQAILWEKSLDDGLTWTDATGTNIGQSYTLPSSLSQTTSFRRKISNACDGVAGYNGVAYSGTEKVEIINPNGVINGKVKSPSGAGVAGITMTAVRTSSPPPGGVANKTYTATTTSNGSYSLQGLYYGLQTSGSGASSVFKISPSKLDHVFTLEGSNPSESFYDAALTQVSPTNSDINFIDETVFSVTGNINQLCYDCVVSGGQSLPVSSPIKDVTFRLTDFPVPIDPNDTIPSAAFKTGIDGNYAITFEEDNDYKISPRFKNHVFVKSDSVITFGTAIEVANVNFTDTSSNVISGTVKADCDQFVGKAVVQFTQQKQVGNSAVFNTAEFILKDTANVSGIYSKRVPAGHYKVEVVDFVDIPVDGNSIPLYNKAEMVAFFGNTDFFPSLDMRMDVTTKDTIFNLVFHEKPQIKVFDLAGPCTKPLNPIFEQGKTKKVAIGVFQGNPNKYVTYNSQTVFGCPVEDDTLTIFTNLESGSAAVELIHFTVNGIDTLTVTPGEPTISGNFEKTLQLGFTDKYDRQGGDASKNDIKPIITGIKSGVGTFTTVSPEIPFLILRDPPGDKSFSFRSAHTSSSTATSFSTKRTNAKDVWIDAKLGVKYAAGLGVSFESAFWANLRGSFAMTTENTSSTEQIITMTNTEEYSTADDAVPGEEGDIYFGGAVNFLYAPVDEISFDATNCTFNSTRDFILAPDGFATDYAYSEYHIKNVVIPNLIAIRDAPATTANEKRKKGNQISVWQQILSENKRLKREAKHHHNISFDGINGPRTSSVTSSSSKVSTIEFQMETDSTLAAEIGMEIGGSGLSEGGTISLRMQTGNSTVITNTQETTTGFTIDDGNDGDYFTVDVKTDPVYNTPVFDLIAGASSCPNEVNTQKRDKVVLSTSNYNMTGIPAGSSQLFQLNLANESESSEERTYYLRYVPGQSTSGAQVSIEGLGAGPFDTQLANNGTHDFTTSVGQFDPNITNFEMFFEVFDECNAGNPSGANFKDNIIVKAQFEDGISPIILSAPENNFALNSGSGANINYSMSGYDLANLSEISFEYAAASGNSWIPAKTILKVNLAANSMDSFWPNSLTDGQYKFRLKLKKGSKIRYSDIVRGTVDRKGPIAFGAPLPNNFSYALGDEISQTFNENLACNALNNSNFTLTRLSNNSAIPAILGCYQNKIILTPTVDVSGWIGDSVEVSLINIKDAAGNIASQSFDWDFRIGKSSFKYRGFLGQCSL